MLLNFLECNQIAILIPGLKSLDKHIVELKVLDRPILGKVHFLDHEIDGFSTKQPFLTKDSSKLVHIHSLLAVIEKLQISFLAISQERIGAGVNAAVQKLGELHLGLVIVLIPINVEIIDDRLRLIIVDVVFLNDNAKALFQLGLVDLAIS